MSAPFKQAALVYAQSFGWRVFPCRGKKPAISKEKGGNGVHDASRDLGQIRQWAQEYPEANIGLACGYNFWALDVDGDEGADSLCELERKHGTLPETVEQITGNGGRHLIFKWGAAGVRNRTRFAPGLDVRAAGGYIIAAPSVHPATGRRYAWSVDGHPADARIADAPKWLIQLIAQHRAAEASVLKVPSKVPTGERNDAITRLIGHLLRRWVDPELAFELAGAFNEARCIPPLPADEVARTFNSILAREISRREKAFAQ